MKINFASYLVEATVNDDNIERLVSVFARRIPKVLGTSVYRYGGKKGVEHLGGELGYLFIFGTRAFRLRAKGGHLTNIDVWDHFATNHGPAHTINVSDLESATVLGSFNEIAKLIKAPKVGRVAVNAMNETIQLDEMASRVGSDKFYDMMVAMYGKSGASSVTWEQIKACADKNDVLIPAYIRSQKIGRGKWNSEPGAAEDVTSKDTKVEPKSSKDDEVKDVIDVDDKGSKVAVAGGKILYIKVTAQDPTTKRFLPAADVPEAQALYKQIQNSMQKGATPDELKDPATLYGHMAQLVEMACRGSLRSLIVYGGPGTGKTYTIMQTVEHNGLVKGEDYQKLSGKASPIKIYETLFMYRKSGLVIFDDLDSMWGNEDATNILKAALDTSPVREISWVSNQTINVSKMSHDRREELYTQIDRDLNGETAKAPPPEDEEDDEDLTPRQLRAKEKAAAKATSMSPDKIKFPSSFEFTGRVIFISNLKKSEFDTAILSRSAKIDMTMTPEQILIRMRSILPTLGGTDVSIERKEELLDALIKQHAEGVFDQVTMREFTKGMDILRSGAPNWKDLLQYS
jgi:hypothetical protein